MSDLEPVNCRCGRESECLRDEVEKGYSDSGTWYYVYCSGCGIRTIPYRTPEEAIEAWNIVMGDKTAEVEDLGDGDYNHHCTDCDRSIDGAWNFCPFCGKKLVWSTI